MVSAVPLGRQLEEHELQEHIERARNRNVNPVKQAEGQRKRLEKIIGQKRTDETRRLMSLASKGIAKGPQSNEHRLAISLAGKGIKKTFNLLGNLFTIYLDQPCF